MTPPRSLSPWRILICPKSLAAVTLVMLLGCSEAHDVDIVNRSAQSIHVTAVNPAGEKVAMVSVAPHQRTTLRSAISTVRGREKSIFIIERNGSRQELRFTWPELEARRWLITID
jgi:hypothetical protein